MVSSVEYGGGDTHSGSIPPANLFIDDGSHVQTRGFISRESAGYGVVAYRSATLEVDWRRSELPLAEYEKRQWPKLHVGARGAEHLETWQDFTGNDVDEIHVAGHLQSIQTPTVWKKLSVPYRILPQKSGLTVEQAAR